MMILTAILPSIKRNGLRSRGTGLRGSRVTLPGSRVTLPESRVTLPESRVTLPGKWGKQGNNGMWTGCLHVLNNLITIN
jgi:hypothetical protein